MRYDLTFQHLVTDRFWFLVVHLSPPGFFFFSLQFVSQLTVASPRSS